MMTQLLPSQGFLDIMHLFASGYLQKAFNYSLFSSIDLLPLSI